MMMINYDDDVDDDDDDDDDDGNMDTIDGYYDDKMMIRCW